MSYNKTVNVGIEPIVDKHDILLGYRLLEPLLRPCVTCGHEADHGYRTWAIPQALFDRWVQVNNEMLQVSQQLTNIYQPTQKRMYRQMTNMRRDYI